MSSCHTVVRVAESSQVGEARRVAVRIAAEASLSETDRGKVAIIATEMANNLHRHASGGNVLIRALQGDDRSGVELLAIDRGPGMANVARCMEDGFSSGGTAGAGLGAMRRLSTEFDIFSAMPSGTVVLSRLFADARPRASGAAQCGVVCVAAPGETACGDNWSIAERDGVTTIMIADGLGHGVLAAQASAEAVRIFTTQPFQRPASFLDSAHHPLRTTRGAAVAAAYIDSARRTLYYAGVGNICGYILGANESRGLVSHNGTLGLQIRAVKDIEYAWPEHGMLVMHSDGLNTRWDLAAYAGLAPRHPAVVAGVLYRDFTRGRDDVTVAVVR